MPMILHRALPGEHVDNAPCWCDPLIVEADDPRTPWELVVALEARPVQRN
jgi:hypothetical protein